MKSFEERLARLEEINNTISEGAVPLEEAVARFEEGIRIAKSLEKELAKIERKIEILVNSPESETEAPHLELFPDLAVDPSPGDESGDDTGADQ